MIKYVPELTSVVFEEIPDRVTLAVEISNCQGNCSDCHSPFLRKDIGEELTESVVDKLLEDNFGVNCFLFLGEGQDPGRLLQLSEYVRSKGIESALYSGRVEVQQIFWQSFDYLKIGPYIPDKGPLNKASTNQRLYKICRHSGKISDLTPSFWK